MNDRPDSVGTSPGESDGGGSDGGGSDGDESSRGRAAGSERPASVALFRVERRGGRSRESIAEGLERRLRDADGVFDASASLRAGVVRASYDDALTSRDELADVVRDEGIPVADRDDGSEEAARDRSAVRREAAFVGLGFAGMVIGFAADWLAAPSVVAWIAYGGAYVFGGWYGLRGAIETLGRRAVDIDLLMILAALGALSIGAPFEGAMLLFLFSLSNLLQDYAIGRSRRAIRALMTLRPESASVLRDGEERTVPIETVAVGDVFVVRPGDRIPLDGTVLAGESNVDQSSLTGESMPVPKGPGDEVYGGTFNENGSLEVEVTRPAGESAIARLIRLVEEAQSERAPTQRLIDRLEQPYVLGVLGMTVVAIAVPAALGAEFTGTFYRAMTLMVAASPCAVIISTPAAVLSAIAAGARQGVLFKGGEHVESAATIDVVAFDKTGTLTSGDTELLDAVVREGVTADSEPVTEASLLRWAAAVQARSEHHLARATLDAARERSIDVPDVRGFRAVVGRGVEGVVDGRAVHIGNGRYFDALDAERPGGVEGVAAGLDAIETFQAEGKTSVLVARETDAGVRIVGWLTFTDAIRPGAASVVAALRELGVQRTVMLTGDSERVARRIGSAVGVDEVRAELSPERKVEIVEELADRYGDVAMVGDGVNDAPALATATLGVAMGGAGTDVALETADVVLLGDDLGKLPYALGLGRATRRTLLTNFGIAFAAIAVMVGTILAAGLPLPLAVVGHEGSTVVVSLNGLRLLGFRN